MKAFAGELADRCRAALELVCQWFGARSMQPFDFQREAWDAYLAGQSGLIHAPTGIGKTYAAWFGPLIEWIAGHHCKRPVDGFDNRRTRDESPRIRVLWVTPLRALSADIREALLRTVEDLDLPWPVECRTGDTPASVRNRQKKSLPTALITTPESLCLLLSYPGAREQFECLRSVVDEWHELVGSKRGVLMELALARLRRWNQGLKTWGLSATLGNTATAMQVLLGRGHKKGYLLEGSLPKSIEIESIIPPQVYAVAGNEVIEMM